MALIWETIAIVVTAIASCFAAVFAAWATWNSKKTADTNQRLAVASRRQRFIEATEELHMRIIREGEITSEILAPWCEVAESEKYVPPAQVKKMADDMYKKTRETSVLYHKLHDTEINLEEIDRRQKKDRYWQIMKEVATDTESNLIKQIGIQMRPYISFTD